MKSKPVKHKTTNTFRFIPFSERIQQIDIRHAALYHIEHQNQARPDSKTDSHFFIAMKKWQVLNLTENFKRFKKEVNHVVTLPQLVHNKDKVLESVIKFLELADPLCLQPLLEITVALAKDLRGDLYTYFPKILECLVELMETKDADLLEWTLVCLTFLFKILKPQLKKDIATVFKKIAPLLSDGRPQYINNFAAESFAFVARDLKDKKKFIEMVLAHIKTNEDVIQGFGHLLYEIIKGVGHKLHSCAPQYMEVLLDILKEPSETQGVLFRVLTQMLQDSFENTKAEEYDMFWVPALKHIELMVLGVAQEGKGLEYLLRLSGQIIEQKRGTFLLDPPQFILQLIKVICFHVTEDVLEVCSKISALILLSAHISVTQEQASMMIKVLLPLPFPNIFIDFVNNMVPYAQFDMQVLPAYIEFLANTDFETDAMYQLMKIVLKKSPLSVNGLKLFEWVKYPLNFGKAYPFFMKQFNLAMNQDIEMVLLNPSRLVSFLVCLPHVENVDVDSGIASLKLLISDLIIYLSNLNIENVNTKMNEDKKEVSKRARKVLFLLGNAIESIAHLSSCKAVKDICKIEDLLLLLLPYAADPNFITALHTLDLYLTAYEQSNQLTLPQLYLTDSFLNDSISSPFHIIRLLTTHIYKLFENMPEMSALVNQDTNEKLSVFSLCHSVEAVTPSVKEYRMQINMLSKMATNTTQYNLLKDTSLPTYSLKYMCGILYFNFRLLWEPLGEFIAGYAHSLPVDEFWPAFYKILGNSFKNVKTDIKKYEWNDDLVNNYEGVVELYCLYNNIVERPDHHNYRCSLLNVMTKFLDICEAKNRDIVVLILSFINDEFRKSHNAKSIYIDVEVHSKVSDVKDEEIKCEDETLEEKEKNEKKDDEEDYGTQKIQFKTLIHIFRLLSQFKNPRALYKEPEFWELYLDFLKSGNSTLQKFAFDCIVNYHNININRYKKQLYALIDDKKMSQQMTEFKITEDSEDIHPKDRSDVIPLILRILYAKIAHKVTDKTGRDVTGKAAVMKYLAGCKIEEKKIFIESAFPLVNKYLNMNAKELYHNVYTNLSLKAVINPGKLKGILNLFDLVREHFGGYMKDELLTQFMNIFYFVCSTIYAVLSKDDAVHVVYVKALKNLRTQALATLRKVFDQFHKYPWTSDELYVIFETLVLPLVPNLHHEGIYHPTALLKLFNSWCQNPRYFVLLTTCNELDLQNNPLAAIFDLLAAPKTNILVVNIILDMTEKLLLLVEDQEDLEIPEIKTHHTLPMLSLKQSLKTDVNFGSRIIVPFIPKILEIMKRRIANLPKSKTVNRRDMFILSRVTELVTDPVLSDELLKLILVVLVNKVCMNMAEEDMEHTVTTIINLLGNSANPFIYIKTLAVLFNKVTLVEVRKLLLKMLAKISETAEEKHIVEVITEMNAFNQRWIDQPDFDRRIDAYKLIYQLSESNEISFNLALLIVNNCFYFMKSEKDIGLRDSAGLCLKRILPTLLKKFKSDISSQFLIRDTVLSLISNGIRDTKNEIYRNECISLLGDLVREYPEGDVVLSDLAEYANKEDREVDFFENISHLQMHRRVRALMKFCKIVKKVNKCPAPRTLTNFVLPLATMYLCDDKYSDKNTLIDACIEVISSCCRLLPWYHYEVILKLYLNKLRHSTEHQKQLIRTLTGILDSFHYDLSKLNQITLPKSLTSNMESDKVEITTNIKSKAEDESDEEKEENNKEGNKKETEGDEEDNQYYENLLEVNLENADESLETDVVEEKEVVNVPAFERVTQVSPSVAKRIIKSLSSGLLPQLNRTLGKLSDYEGSHKVNRRNHNLDRQEEDMLRVPIALPLVKLLQKMPGDLLNYQFSGIIIKLCSFLKSPLKQVRSVARDVLKKIMLTVGTAYVGRLLEHLNILLTRGFQVHVLVTTIHTILDALKNEFKAGELNEILENVLNICSNDMFGSLSDEKDVKALHSKTPEAKPSKKVYVTLLILAQNITEKCLINLVMPFKEILEKDQSKKTVLKAQDALKHITAGLVSNKFIEPESLFILLHGMASQSIPQFMYAPERRMTPAQKNNILKAKPDCFLIEPPPKRNKEAQAKQVKTAKNASAYVLIEFSFNILYVMLKREILPKSDVAAFVDPIIPLLLDAVKSKRDELALIAVKCLTCLWNNKISTPTLKSRVTDLVDAIYAYLHKYGTHEIGKENASYPLVNNCFKAISSLIRNVNYMKLNKTQLKILVLYAEADIDSEEKQTESFPLLRAILNAKLVSEEINTVMEKVAKISITSDSDKARSDARQLFLVYLTNYAMSKHLERYVQFFVSQLSYEVAHGRHSALAFIEMIVRKVAAPSLYRHASFLLVSVGAVMMSDESPVCRAAAAAAIEAMLAVVDLTNRHVLFDLVMTLMEDTQPAHFELAAQLCSRFVNVEKAEFKDRLHTVLPQINSKLILLSNDIVEGRFVKIKLEQNEDKSEEDNQKEKDHGLIQMLNLIDKIIENCPASVTSEKFKTKFDEIGQQCQVFLAYPHSWVRLKSAKVLGQLLSKIEGSELEDIMSEKQPSERGFVYDDTKNSLRSLVLDLCAQYTPGVSKDMSDQVTEALHHILKLVYSMPSCKLKDRELVDSEVDSEAKVNIRWIVYKMRKAVNVEVSKAPTCENIRSSVFTAWMHLISELEVEDLNKVIDLMVSAIVRELSTGDATGPSSISRQFANRLAKKLRRKIGDIEFGKLAADAQTRLNVKRAERKKLVLQEKVHNPEKAAKRKMQMKEKKKIAKKMKIEMLQGKRQRPKKRKAEDINLEDDLLKDD